jgi:transcriptional regulator with XRE-family HTH domain
LREVREATDFSQRRLGIAAGIDPFVASTRINRYERGVSWPDVSIIFKLAETLGVPAATFFTEDERLAETIVLFARASKRKQDAVVKMLQSSKSKGASVKRPTNPRRTAQPMGKAKRS